MTVDCDVDVAAADVCQYQVTPATVLVIAEKVPVVQAGLETGEGTGGVEGVVLTVKITAVVVTLEQLATLTMH